MADGQAADDSQFEAGYGDNVPTETPAPEPTPEPKPTEAPVATEAPVDPLKDLTARLEKFESSQKALSGHLGSLIQWQRDTQQRMDAAAAATKKVADAPTADEIAEATKSPEEWKQLKEDYPEWATATEKFIDSRLAGIKPSSIDPQQIEKVVVDRVRGETEAVRTEIVNASLEAVFPGWQDDVKTEQFSNWFKGQSAEVQALADSTKVGDAARMLKLYEKSKSAKQGTPAPEPKNDLSARQKRIEAAVNPRGAGGHAPAKTDIDEFEAGYSG